MGGIIPWPPYEPQYFLHKAIMTKQVTLYDWIQKAIDAKRILKAPKQANKLDESSDDQRFRELLEYDRALNNRDVNYQEYTHNIYQLRQKYILQYRKEGEEFDLFRDLRKDEVPANRIPESGIRMLPLKYHKGNVVYVTPTLPKRDLELTIEYVTLYLRIFLVTLSI